MRLWWSLCKVVVLAVFVTITARQLCVIALPSCPGSIYLSLRVDTSDFILILTTMFLHSGMYDCDSDIDYLNYIQYVV